MSIFDCLLIPIVAWFLVCLTPFSICKVVLLPMLCKFILVEVLPLDVKFKEGIANQTETKCKEEYIDDHQANELK